MTSPLSPARQSGAPAAMLFVSPFGNARRNTLVILAL